MNQPTAVIVIRNNREIGFHLQKIPHNRFSQYLKPFKLLFPQMKWDSELRQWILSVNELKLLYETCRILFHPGNIDVTSTDYSISASGSQLSLFG